MCIRVHANDIMCQENWHTAALAGFAGRCHQEGSAKHSLRSPSNDITFGDFVAPEDHTNLFYV